ncbi:MAG: hypothetical protein WBV69_08315, partial [Candidatus Sulfotelmatobacter sp.]
SCWALCQNVDQSLPDAPSMQAATQAQKFNLVVEEARSFFEFGAGGNARVMRQGGFAVSEKTVSNQEESDTIFEKYLKPSVLKQQSSYHSSSSGSLMGRATSAASRIFVTRDESGKGRLNTAYLLRALTSVAADAASRPYWRRSVTEPFSDFGSTVGNDAGMNLWREFGPSIRQLVEGHTPKFVSKIEERISHK